MIRLPLRTEYLLRTNLDRHFAYFQWLVVGSVIESLVKLISVRETLSGGGCVVRGVKILSIRLVLILSLLLVLVLTVQFSDVDA